MGIPYKFFRIALFRTNYLKFFYTFLTLFSLIISHNAHARLSDFSVGLGNLTQYIKRVQEDEAGDLNSFDSNLFLTTTAKLDLPWKKFGFYPQFGFLFPEKGRDPLIKKWHYYIIGDLGFNIHKFQIRAGVGLYMTRISGSGGTQDLPNGSSTTSFFMPAKSTTSRNLIANIGAHFLIHRLWSGSLELHAFNLEDSTDRAFSYSFAFHYHFGDIFKRLRRNKGESNEKPKKSIFGGKKKI